VNVPLRQADAVVYTLYSMGFRRKPRLPSAVAAGYGRSIYRTYTCRTTGLIVACTEPDNPRTRKGSWVFIGKTH